MTQYVPLIANANNAQIEELPSGDDLNLTGSNIAAVINITSTGLISTTGNISSGNVLTSGLISSTGNITGGNILTAGIISSAGNVIHGNILTAGQVSATGNVSGGNILTAGQVSATGNVSGGNLYVTGSGNILGNLNVQGNITFIGSNVIVTNDLYIELANNQSTYANINNAGLAVGPVGNTLTYWQYNTSANAWTTNVGISSTGNVTGNYFIGNGSQLTGITSSQIAGITTISNGTSNVSIATANGAITGSVNGTATLSLGANAIAIGNTAGTSQGNDGIAIGRLSGASQAIQAIAIGLTAGFSSQGAGAIAIGPQTANNNQGSQAIAIGAGAGYSSQGINAIAIGALAGNSSQPGNSIIINASGGALNGTNAGFYVNPIRNDTGNAVQTVYYNTSTKEVTYAGSQVQGEPETSPLLSAFTAVNQGSATFVQRTGYISMYTPTTSQDNLRLLVQPILALNTTWSAIVRINSIFFYEGYCRYGMALYDTVSGKVQTLGMVSNNSAYIDVTNWNSPTSFNGGQVSGRPLNTPPAWLRISCDGTSLSYSMSADGYQWVPYITVANNANFLVPNRIGFFTYAAGTVLGGSTSILSWTNA